MKYLTKIFPFLKRLLLVAAAVSFLAACSNKEDAVIGEDISVSEQSCLSCEILVMIYDAVGYNVGHLHAEFSRAAMPITMVGFAIWLALRLLKFVSSVTETNAGEVWNEIIKKAFICLICGMLASSSTMLKVTMDTIVFPVYSAFLDLGTQILQASTAGGKENPDNSFIVFGQELSVAEVKMDCSQVENSGKEIGVGFPTSIREKMRCMINMLSAHLNLGSDIATQAMHNTENGTGIVVGFVLWSSFWIVNLSFVFYLVDAIFQMGIIILLLPLFIISYAFGPTRKWTGIGFSKVLASAGFMMCFSIIVASVLRAMIELIKNNQPIFNPSDLYAVTQDISIGFICILLIGFLIYGSMGVSQQLTSGLIGSKVDSNFQKNMKAVVQTGIKWALTALGALFTWGTSLAPQSSIAFVRTIGKAAKKVQAFREKAQHLAGRK